MGCSNAIAIHQRRSSQQGFAAVFLLALVPVLLTVLSATVLTGQLTLNLSGPRHACRLSLAQGLESAGRSYRQLLRLNPQALALRLRNKKAIAQLAAAIATGNPAAVATAEARLLKVQAEQAALHQKQQAHVLRARLDLAAAQTEAMAGLSRWRSPGVTLAVARPLPAQVALRPDRPDLAPIWLVPPDFRRVQTLAQSWHLSMSSWSIMKKTLPSKNRFSDSCAVTLVPQGDDWIAQLNEDRFSSSFF